MPIYVEMLKFIINMHERARFDFLLFMCVCVCVFFLHISYIAAKIYFN